MSAIHTLDVFVDNAKVGWLSCENTTRFVFNYAPGVEAHQAASLVMPVRMESYVNQNRVHPIFEMSLPEGGLRDVLRRQFGKLGFDDDMGLLALTGQHRIGRVSLRTSDGADTSSPEKGAGALEQVLESGDVSQLFADLMERYARCSGVSGVQPKFLLPPDERASIVTDHFIVKSSEGQFPYLAVNESLCLKAAGQAGLAVPETRLSTDGTVIAVRRFDLRADGTRLGFEDLCALQALPTADKYRSSLERVAKTVRQFSTPGQPRVRSMEALFRLMVINTALRNGDAHLKNFGMLYDVEQGTCRLSPAFDIVTTTVYDGLSNDVPALTLGGKRAWPLHGQLKVFGEGFCELPGTRVQAIVHEVRDAMASTAQAIPAMIEAHPGFRETGKRMLFAWDQGLRSLDPRIRNRKLMASQIRPSPITEIIQREKLSHPEAGKTGPTHGMRRNRGVRR